jgi:hypothetical protein
MAVATFGMLDLSIVTDVLKDVITSCALFKEINKKFTISVTGNAPDVARGAQGCNLSVYLYHVQKDAYQSNALNTNPAQVPGFPRAQRIPLQPLSLDLLYLLTASSDAGYLQEQQAMSVAMRCLYEHPIITTTVPFGAATPEQFTLQLEVDGADQVGRLWQATTVAMRLSATYKVTVIFVTPEAPPAAGPPVKQVTLLGGAATVPFASAGGQLTGTKATVVYRPPASTAANPMIRNYDLSPAVVAPGEPFIVFGGGLIGQRVFIAGGNLPETDITGWIDAGFETPSDTRLAIRLPNLLGAPPAAAPPPGIYTIETGTGALRSNSTPLSVAAGISNVGNPPLLPSVAGVYTVQGLGIQGAVQLFLDTVGLSAGNAAPGPGEFLVNAAGTQIEFQTPTGMKAGRWPLRLRVNEVESAPSWWVDVP